MTISYGKNIASLKVQRQLGLNTALVAEASERLSSGLRINRGSDDSAALAVATTLKSRSRVFTQAIRNLNDGLSALSIADGALTSLSNIVQQLGELANQSANGSLSATQRRALDTQAGELVEEYNRIIESTGINRQMLLDQSLGLLTLQGGYGAQGSISMAIGSQIARTAASTSYDAAYSVTLGGSISSFLTGDLDGDGQDDVLSLSNTTGAVTVRISNGDGTFTSMANTGDVTSTNTLSARLGDINGDGNLDLVALAFTGINYELSVYTGNGDGTFAAQQMIDTYAIPYGISVGDFNGDGRDDVIVSYDNGSDVAALRLGQSNGSLGAESIISGLTSAPSVVADFNGDGIDDIVENQTVYLGNGSGTFQNAGTSSFGTGVFSNTSALGDFNRDGIIDIVVANSASSTLRMMLGVGDGSFSVGSTITGLTGNALPIAGDFDGDGALDILVRGSSGERHFFLGNDDGTLTQSNQFVSGSPVTIAPADFNGDGILELYYRASGTQIGIYESATSQVGTIQRLNLLTAQNARDELTNLEELRAKLANERGSVGANQSRIASALAVLSAQTAEFDNAAARIESADIAAEAARAIRGRILQDTGAAILAQANLAPQIALQLLDSAATSEA